MKSDSILNFPKKIICPKLDSKEIVFNY